MERLATILGCKGNDVHVITPDATVLEAVDRMCRARVGALVVVSGSAVVGMFSERDLMVRVVLERREPARTHVGDVMTASVLTVSEGTSSHDAMSLMTQARVRHLPVTDGGRLTGLVSIGDLVRWTVAERERALDDLEGYVVGRYPG